MPWPRRVRAGELAPDQIRTAYNDNRRIYGSIQDALGMLSLDEFEALHLTGQRPVGAPGTVPVTAAGMAPQALPGVAADAVTL